MAEPTYMFSLQQVAQALLAQQGIKEGLWTLAVEFNFSAASAGPSQEELVPAAIVGVGKIGLNKVDKEGPLTFDAAKLNPVKRAVKRSKKAD